MNVVLPDQQREQLETLARQRGTTLEALVRQALEDWLAEQRSEGWQPRLTRLLERRRAVARDRGFDEAEVERDVSEALDDVRAARRP